MKFKVGDKVRLVGDPQSVRAKSAIYGQIATIRKVDPTYSYPYTLEEPHDFNVWRDTELELVEMPKIVITTDNVKVVTAKMYVDGKVVKTAEAKCAPEDNFDFTVGAKLACDRLTKNEPTKPKYYNGKVVCVDITKDVYSKSFIIGKVYNIVEGKIIDENGLGRPLSGHRITGKDDLNTGYFSEWRYKFIPFVEG